MPTPAITAAIPAKTSTMPQNGSESAMDNTMLFADTLSGAMDRHTGKTESDEAVLAKAEETPAADITETATPGVMQQAEVVALRAELAPADPAIAMPALTAALQAAALTQPAVAPGHPEASAMPVEMENAVDPAMETSLPLAAQPGLDDPTARDASPTHFGMASPANLPIQSVTPGKSGMTERMAALDTGSQKPRMAPHKPEDARISIDANNRAQANQAPRLAEAAAAPTETPGATASAPQPSPSLSFNLPVTAGAPAVNAQAAQWIAPNVGSAAWADAMGQKMVWMASEQIQQAELRLSPEGLGPMQIVLSIENGAADVRFLAHDAQVREALQSALPKLQEQMTSAGFSLERVSIDAGTAGRQGNQEQGSSARHAGKGNSRAHAEITPIIVSGGMPARQSGLIDTFA